jgi:hypothetical protein
MTRVCRWRNYGVYVYAERGERHHRPHAHIKHRDQRVGSIFLDTLLPYDVVRGERLPGELLDLIAAAQEELLACWEELSRVTADE